ncbi:MAG: sugar phosphate nucleotidyltransferase [Chloroflexota bacterium]|nr:sugar phosphate nucleotidyltransferase [Chloroflexota bacterium]
MNGVILVGGSGSRLDPLTRVTNKHLLPIYDKPMVFYPIQALVNAGIKDIMLVTGGNNAGDFLRLLGNGSDFGLKRLHYTYQDRPAGIAHALGLTRDFADGDSLLLMLGDNIIEGNLLQARRNFEAQGQGARVVLTRVENPASYGVVEIENGRITSITEKPANPKSNLVQTGIYFYDERVFDVVSKLRPSGRGELEITDVNNSYLQAGNLEYDILEGFWADCGESFETYLESQNLVATHGANKLNF